MAKTGGNAFPTVVYAQPAEGSAHIMTIAGGMTLRDYFAAKALGGVLAGSSTYSDAARAAYRAADAMLLAREA